MKEVSIKPISIFISILFLVVVAGCNNPVVPEAENQAPYPVTYADSTLALKQAAADNTFQLLIEEVAGLKDPDGDVVLFRSTELPSWISLDAATGLVTVDVSQTRSAVSVSFWSEDENGADTSAASISIDISVYNNQPYEVTSTDPKFNIGTGLYNGTSGDLQTFQLDIDEVGGLKDPDNDDVFFRSDTLPAYMSLDAVSGLLTIFATVPEISGLIINFWSEDELGADTSDNPLTVSFTFANW